MAMMFTEMLLIATISLHVSEWSITLGNIKTAYCPLSSVLIHIISTKKQDKENKSKYFCAEIRKWAKITENTGSEALSSCGRCRISFKEKVSDVRSTVRKKMRWNKMCIIMVSGLNKTWKLIICEWQKPVCNIPDHRMAMVYQCYAVMQKEQVS